jgi:hypothetical protein
MQCSLDRFPAVAAFVAGLPRRWSDLHIDEHALLELCRADDLSALCFHRLSGSAVKTDWPPRLVEMLSEAVRVQVGEELLRGAETRTVVDALANAGIRALLVKGTPLAYSVYPTPASRPRDDTDLLIPAADVAAARGVMAVLGYATTVHCSDLFSQFEVQKRDRFGVVHAFDVHWKISTQPVFADVLTYREMLPRTVPVPALGPAAVMPSAVDALLLACVHPVMHHQNTVRALWAYDAHLLALHLTAGDFDDFVRHARQKRVAAVCARQLRLTQTLFDTPIPAYVVAQLSAVTGEPSADYLASQRRWHHELASSVRGLPRVGDRVKLLREVLLPSPSYMLGAYGLRGKLLGPWLLPALYMHRNLRGAWKILMGKK